MIAYRLRDSISGWRWDRSWDWGRGWGCGLGRGRRRSPAAGGCWGGGGGTGSGARVHPRQFQRAGQVGAQRFERRARQAARRVGPFGRRRARRNGSGAGPVSRRPVPKGRIPAALRSDLHLLENHVKTRLSFPVLTALLVTLDDSSPHNVPH